MKKFAILAAVIFFVAWITGFLEVGCNTIYYDMNSLQGKRYACRVTLMLTPMLPVDK